MITQQKDSFVPSILMKNYIEKGMKGENEGIPIHHPRISNCFQIRKSMLILLGGFAGSGKTSLVDELFVLQPFDYLKKHNLLDTYKVIYWSLERPKEQKLAKWLSRRIFLQHGILIDPKRIEGWYNKSYPLSSEEVDYIFSELPYLDELFDTIMNFHSGRINPTGIRKYIDEYAVAKGNVEHLDQFNKVYIPHNPRLITMNIFDHIGKLKKESGKSKKELLDDFSDDCSNIYRDLYGISSILISQFNRSIANPMRIKNGDVEPQAEDFKETGDTYEDVDICLTVFDPWKYKVPDPSGYDLNKMKRLDGAKMYRNIRLLKNNHGVEDIRFGFGYQVETGIFKLLNKKADITEGDYQDLLSSSLFLNNQY